MERGRRLHTTISKKGGRDNVSQLEFLVVVSLVSNSQNWNIPWWFTKLFHKLLDVQISDTL